MNATIPERECEWYKVEDRASGCRIIVHQLPSGNFAIQFDNGQESSKTLDDLVAEGFPVDVINRLHFAYELLRQHVVGAHR